MIIRNVFLALFFLLIPSFALAVPPLMNYQGKLTDAAGTPLTGTKNITFSLYDAATGGTQLWTETQSANLTNGIFSVTLGSVAMLPADVCSGDSLYLGVTVEGDAEMTPRQRITSNGYTFKAGTADAVSAGAVSTQGIADEAVTDAKILSLNASKLTGTVSDSALPANVAKLDASQTFSGTQSGSFSGTFTGDGSGLTNLPTGTLPSNVALLDSAQTLTGVKAFNPSSGTVPFTVDVSKAAMVANLNADTVDGQHASAFAPATGSTNYVAKTGDLMAGTLTCGITSGTGRAGYFLISNTGNSSDALYATTNGAGNAGYFQASGSGNGVFGRSFGAGNGVYGVSSGTGKAGSFEIQYSNNTSDALYATTIGTGYALKAESSNATPKAASFTGQVDITGPVNVTGAVTATSFSGDGANLANVSCSSIWGRAVSVVSPAAGQALTWNGTSWAPASPGTYTAGTGLGLSGSQFYLDTSYTDTLYVKYGTSTALTLNAPVTVNSTVSAATNSGNVITGTITSGPSIAVLGTTSGTGYGVEGATTGSGSGGYFQTSGSGNGAVGLATGTGTGLYGVSFGTGRAGRFEINNAGNSADALYATTNGTGYAGNFNGKVNVSGNLTVGGTITGNGSGLTNLPSLSGTYVDLASAQTITGVKAFNPSSGTVPFAVDASKAAMVANLNADTVDGQHASAFASSTHDHDGLYVKTAGDNMYGTLTVNQLAAGGAGAGAFSVSSATNTVSALMASTNGNGNAVYATTYGSGNGVYGYSRGTGSAGYFEIYNAGSNGIALYTTTNGNGSAGYFQVNNPSNYNDALYATTNGTGNAGNFQGKVNVTGNLTVGNNLIVSAPAVPATATSTGTTGQIAWDAAYVYVCVAPNTWKRSALSSW